MQSQSTHGDNQEHNFICDLEKVCGIGVFTPTKTIRHICFFFFLTFIVLSKMPMSSFKLDA